MAENSSKTKIVLVVLAVLVVAVVAVNLIMGGGGADAADGLYVNVANGETFLAPRDQFPPISTPDGDGQAVAAHVFGCGDCSDPFIAYVEKWTPEGKQAQQSVVTDPIAGEMQSIPASETQLIAQLEQGHLVAAYEAGSEPEWVPMETEAGEAVMEAARSSKCQGLPTRPCTAGDYVE